MSFETKFRNEKLEQAGSSLKAQPAVSARPIHDFDCAPVPLSPVASQIHNLQNQCDTLGVLVDQLIAKTQTILNGDPRNGPVAASSSEPVTCELEGVLSGLLDKLTRHSDLLATAIHRIQL